MVLFNNSNVQNHLYLRLLNNWRNIFTEKLKVLCPDDVGSQVFSHQKKLRAVSLPSRGGVHSFVQNSTTQHLTAHTCSDFLFILDLALKFYCNVLKVWME